MLRLIIGVFIVLHGLVHLLYFGQSWRLFELQPEMVWPEDSWAFSRLLGDDATRWLTSICCILAVTDFVASGMAILMRQVWWHPVVVGSTIFSSLIFILFWDGEMQRLDAKGGIGLLINIVILVPVFILRWPDLEF